MNMKFYRKLPIPKEIKEQFPPSSEVIATRERTVEEIKKAISGESDKFLLIVGPCSADREDAVLDYVYRLAKLQDKVRDKILIVPRIYTNKPRTTGEGYKGMLHQPNPNEAPDLLRGIIAIRRMHMRAISETGLGCADEMLYPENHRYLSDIICYVAVGARSVENQQHRLTASGLDIPVGMKNPTEGDISIMLNSVKAAQGSHMFIYRGWEVETAGNPYAHAILRGYVDSSAKSHPNYHFEDLYGLYEAYLKSGLQNPAVIVDTNHANSGKCHTEQPRIAKEVLHSMRYSPEIRKTVKGLMIESYIEGGSQKIYDTEIYGKSITDPCLSWFDTERLIYEIADKL
jgi:3-deoxy-7-phosphoheptulonate synthase